MKDEKTKTILTDEIAGDVMFGFTTNFTSPKCNPVAFTCNGVINAKEYTTRLRCNSWNQSRCSKRSALTMKSRGCAFITQYATNEAMLPLSATGCRPYQIHGCGPCFVEVFWCWLTYKMASAAYYILLPATRCQSLLVQHWRMSDHVNIIKRKGDWVFWTLPV
jgi:hypothetical protein